MSIWSDIEDRSAGTTVRKEGGEGEKGQGPHPLWRVQEPDQCGRPFLLPW